ncbi:hypothetical protein [Candidatus Methylacidithermus pantelleriae]|uniref:Uncharacterized protein n=1 Tax=Candidatus Methylacidithermus pantelleriae TaxID=2744239 RepID=A0A8J2FW27_9BACT|nr:hypothetical protein [Candidatus Methylacidithermus pantelleriae]CAF0696971.1 hypothetical protein MPNT_200014 [Candidatus Methylacidithermus pantelleriae]
MRLRLLDSWESPSQYLVLEKVRFAYGQEAIFQALAVRRIIIETTKTGKTCPEGGAIAALS